MSDDVVRFSTQGRCAVITIDRPEMRNAIDPAVAEGLEAAIDRLEADDELWVGILTGTPPAFSAGADLRAAQRGEGDRLSTARGGFAGVVRRERDKPLIAAVDGAAYGGGAELALACDLIVAGEDARFALPEVRRGLLPSGGGAIRLARCLPRNVAMACLLTGEPLDAKTAHRHGLVNELVAPGRALEAALELARRVAACAPLAVRAARRIALHAGEPEPWAESDASNREIMATADAREGIAAFVDKRPPVWTAQ